MTGRLPACVIDVGTGLVDYYYSYDHGNYIWGFLLNFVIKK